LLRLLRCFCYSLLLCSFFCEVLPPHLLSCFSLFRPFNASYRLSCLSIRALSCFHTPSDSLLARDCYSGCC
jgi:hypothetical protein